ncbi:hypothetical protein AU191_20255 [Mycolicibacterium acapulense]|nr:hypothetical protein AU191_20255 [Mycolicibacterium acapulense]
MGPDAFAAIAGAMRLRGILYHQQPVFSGQRQDLGEICWLAEKVHWNQGTRSGGYGSLNPSGVEVPLTGDRFHPNWNRTGARYRDPRCDEGVRWHDDLVARADTERLQGEGDGVQTTADSDRMFGAREGGKFTLKRSCFLTKHVPAVAHDPFNGFENRSLEFPRSGANVQKRHSVGRVSHFSSRRS